jgi:hypothetical protein
MDGCEERRTLKRRANVGCRLFWPGLNWSLGSSAPVQSCFGAATAGARRIVSTWPSNTSSAVSSNVPCSTAVGLVSKLPRRPVVSSDFKPVTDASCVGNRDVFNGITAKNPASVNRSPALRASVEWGCCGEFTALTRVVARRSLDSKRSLAGSQTASAVSRPPKKAAGTLCRIITRKRMSPYTVTFCGRRSDLRRSAGIILPYGSGNRTHRRAAWRSDFAGNRRPAG